MTVEEGSVKVEIDVTVHGVFPCACSECRRKHGDTLRVPVRQTMVYSSVADYEFIMKPKKTPARELHLTKFVLDEENGIVKYFYMASNQDIARDILRGIQVVKFDLYTALKFLQVERVICLQLADKSDIPCVLYYLREFFPTEKVICQSAGTFIGCFTVGKKNIIVDFLDNSMGGSYYAIPTFYIPRMYGNPDWLKEAVLDAECDEEIL